jgi:hypothetical protein
LALRPIFTPLNCYGFRRLCGVNVRFGPKNGKDQAKWPGFYA